MSICQEMPRVGILFCHLYMLLISVDASDLNVLSNDIPHTLWMLKRELRSNNAINKEREKKNPQLDAGHQTHTRGSASKSSSNSSSSSSQRL